MKNIITTNILLVVILLTLWIDVFVRFAEQQDQEQYVPLASEDIDEFSKHFESIIKGIELEQQHTIRREADALYHHPAIVKAELDKDAADNLFDQGKYRLAESLYVDALNTLEEAGDLPKNQVEFADEIVNHAKAKLASIKQARSK